MIVKNKRTGVEITVTRDEWAKMQSNNLARNYNVIDASDANLKARLMTKTPEPMEIIDFLKPKQRKKDIININMVPEEAAVEEMPVEEVAVDDPVAKVPQEEMQAENKPRRYVRKPRFLDTEDTDNTDI